MTNDQRLWMNSHIADGLRALELNIHAGDRGTRAASNGQAARYRGARLPTARHLQKEFANPARRRKQPASPGFFPIRLGAVIAYEVG